jgi:hypothetical protein
MENPLHETSSVTQQQHPVTGSRRGLHTALVSLAVVVCLYLLCAYIILPQLWKRDVARHSDLFKAPRITHTVDGIPGDPVNLALLGSEIEVIRGMTSARWYPADPITFRTSVRIAVDSVLRRPDDDAPVSTLELFGRKQDLAFEQPVGDNPRQRHHVRFWRWGQLYGGREVWFGAATYDERVGLSHTTGQVTHHIGPDVDAERDRILNELRKAIPATEIYWLTNWHEQRQGKNGGGDPWRTDGRLGVAALPQGSSAAQNKP